MKVTIVKYLNPKGKVVEMRKDNFKGSYMPENTIEEYEVEIKGEDSNETSWLKDLKIKYESGNYILLTPIVVGKFINWFKVEDPLWVCNNYVLIHNKHKDILEAYLKNPSVEIECTNYISKDADMETIWYQVDNFIEDYNEEFWYRLKVKDLVWYEKEDNFRIAVKQIKSLNGFTDKDGEIGIMEKFTDDNGISVYVTDGYHTPLQWLKCYRPATESEALSLVYKPQQKVSKENTLAESKAESDRLKELFTLLK